MASNTQRGNNIKNKEVLKGKILDARPKIIIVQRMFVPKKYFL